MFVVSKRVQLQAKRDINFNLLDTSTLLFPFNTVAHSFPLSVPLTLCRSAPRLFAFYYIIITRFASHGTPSAISFSFLLQKNAARTNAKKLHKELATIKNWFGNLLNIQ